MDVPALVAEWLTHLAAMCSRVCRTQWPGFDSARARLPTNELSLNNFYAHDEQGVSRVGKRVRLVLYKL